MGMSVHYSTKHLNVPARPSTPSPATNTGIFLHYLIKFLEVSGKAGHLDMSWVNKLKAKCEAECQWLVENRLTSERGFCVYWGEKEAEKFCKEDAAYPPQGMVVASQLYLLAHKMQTMGNHPRA
jgi:hypothetical protein